jgi:hypothetical protein
LNRSSSRSSYIPGPGECRKIFHFPYLIFFLQSSFLSSSRSFHPFANILSGLRLLALPSFVSPHSFLLPPNSCPLIVQFAP